MKKRILKITAFVLAIVIIFGVCWFANGLLGNPISYMLAKNSAKKHIEANYADKDFVLEGVAFSFKDGNYYAHISSPSSIDSDFSLTIDMLGNLKKDMYEDRVLSGRNTALRIGDDYRKKVDAVFDSKAFPYNVDIAFGEIEFIEREYIDDPYASEYAIIIEDLVLDAFYDANEMGSRAGRLTVYVEENTVSIERLTEILLGMRKIFDDAGVRFYAIDCILEYPKNEDYSRKEGRFEVMDFLYSDIYESGMTERVRASDEAARAYYAKQDAEKLK